MLLLLLLLLLLRGGGSDAGCSIENRRGVLPLLSSPGSTLWFCPVHSGMPLSAIFTGQRLW